MRIDRVWIDNFKNLNDLSVDFDEGHSITVVIGKNGSGKSNLIEALVIIFRDLDLKDQETSFAYKIKYECNKHQVEIDWNPSTTPKANRLSILVDGKSVSKTAFYDSRNEYLPANVFGYYSGPSDRLQEHFIKHQENYRDDLIKQEDQKKLPLRRLFYAQNIHSLFVLLAFFQKRNHNVEKQVFEKLGITDLDSVLFCVRQPYWTSREGNPYFWNARGFVSDFLDELFDLSLAPIRLKKQVPIGLKKKTQKEFIYLYIKDLKALLALSKKYKTQSDFFKTLESTYMSDLIDDIRIRVEIKNLDGTLTYRELSEGEQQLLMVIGLLLFTKEKDSLFLLDEPDTHLNPAWSMQYLDVLKEVIGDDDRSQIIMSTHDPIMIAPLLKEQVQVMYRDPGGFKVEAFKPQVDPRGLGYAGILTSEMFGMETTLDEPTRELLERRKQLEMKEPKTKKEKEELQTLTDELDNLGFTTSFRDEDYQLFLREWYNVSKELKEKHQLTSEEQSKKVALARQIIEKLIQEKTS